MSTRWITIASLVLTLGGVTQADTIHVNWDGSGDYLTIQEGIVAGSGGDEILVHPGTYLERIDLLGKAITVRSTDGPEVTIIDGNGGGTVVTCTGGEGPDTLIEGFTITGGTGASGGGMYNLGSSPTLTDCTFIGNNVQWGSGGGMYNTENSSPTLNGCVFSGNAAYIGGGIYNDYSSPTLNNCTFSENLCDDGEGYDGYGGGMHNNYSSPTLTGCTFSGNSIGQGGSGGGMANLRSSPTLTNCTFSGNSAEYGQGGGMSTHSFSDATLNNCTFSGNSAQWGGGIHSDNSSPTLNNCTFAGNEAGSYGGGMSGANSDPTLINCIFTGNSATLHGGGMCNSSYSNPTLTSCTFSGNSATSDGGGMYSHQFSHSTLTNCILWGNVAPYGPQILHFGGSTTQPTYCCIQGGWPGVGNINADPLFVDADGPDDTYGTPDDDLHLMDGSPCINAGNNAAVPVELTVDCDGDVRIQHCRIDMGADETPYYRDCNTNGVADACDIEQATSPDCNVNGVPDECEIGGTEDCNTNGVPDLCDIHDGTSEDCNANGIPDECMDLEDDCNTNGVPDECDVTAGSSEDCNANGIPDECDIAILDCNSNGIPDDCDIADCDGSLWCSDCNANDVPDECDIASGTSPDTNPPDGIPDDCQGVPPLTGACCLGSTCIVATESACEAAGGAYQGDRATCEDVECPASNPADLDGDGDVDLDDFMLFQQQFSGPQG